MLRSPAARVGLVLSGVLLLWLLDGFASSGELLGPPELATAIELAPAAFLGFGVLAVIAPLSAGGGTELVPTEQLVAFPVRARTVFLGGLVLAPVNLVWVVQLLVLAAFTSYLAPGHVARGALTTAAYVGCLTVWGQTLAWLIAGLRQTRTGRRGVTATGVAAIVAVVVAVRTGAAGALLVHNPARTVVHGIGSAAAGRDLRWATTTGVLLLLGLAGLLVGARVCGWALRRPGDGALDRSGAPVQRRATARGPLRQLLAVDRASAWRAPALRRGAVVLAVLPGLAAAGVALPWTSLVVLPGLVAAGAGLLFGVNAFALDGRGATWLASLPHDPALAIRAKLLVVTETVLAAVVLSVVAGSLRIPGLPTATEVTAIAASGVTCAALVVASCLRRSVRRPHAADLGGPRAAVAPPGAMAVASAQLALPTAFTALLVSAASKAPVWWVPLVVASIPFLLAVLSVLRTLRHYGEPTVRARIVQTVAA
jgi:hypothetical protein